MQVPRLRRDRAKPPQRAKRGVPGTPVNYGAEKTSRGSARDDELVCQ